MPAFSPPFRRCLLGFCAVFLLASCHRKLDPAESAQQFFQDVFAGQMNEAYKATSFNFQLLQSEKAFETILSEMGLVGGKFVQVGTPEIDGSTAKMPTDVTTAKNERLKFIVTMSHEHGVWRLFSLKTPRDLETGVSENKFSLSATGAGASFHEALDQPFPNDEALRHLVRDALLEFNRAIRARSFTDFYEYVSSAWQSQLTEKQLQRAFQEFIDKNVDISIVADMEPTFDGTPQLTSDGLLLISGRYPTKPYQLMFGMKFIYEVSKWKLFGVSITSGPGDNASTPAAEN